MTPIETILGRVGKARQRQPGQWSAHCPGPNHAHDDRTPSLSIRENSDGAVLLHCFGGCDVGSIVATLGLELADLFPPRETPPGAPKRTPRLLTDGQALDLLADEALLIAVAGGNVGHGVALTQIDLDRVMQATGRINYLRHEARCHHA